MFDINALIHNYGYWIVFLGSMIEGESVLLTASALAYTGVLSIYKVFALSFVGTCIADQLLYNLGYYIGPGFLEKWKTSRKLFNRLKHIAIKYQNIYILSFRFIYGIRIISPIIIGVVKVDQKKYAILNIVASFIWAFISCLIGYFLGSAVSKMGIFNLKKPYIYLIILGLVGIVILASKLISSYLRKKYIRQGEIEK
ncbi:DedA family protein [Candidatus Nesciobacter abundans]|uniref:DedA family protein n=1 Tax=Candidatus Nesciobacter abundans TaxID=2601668 RepID=A0A5C0UG78_9PROT|nr:DedA family protein [Candidatus Nesciobacter abundans]QEK39068.1 DedA family protein [Candidatus Nesciobacter abundans]